MGGRWEAFLVTRSRQDGLVIVEFLDDETTAQTTLTLASSDNITTETLRVFTLDEFRDLVDSLPHGMEL